jgi:hypothetical protein
LKKNSGNSKKAIHKMPNKSNCKDKQELSRFTWILKVQVVVGLLEEDLQRLGSKIAGKANGFLLMLRSLTMQLLV